MWCFILIVIILIISLLVDVSYYFRLGVMYFMSRFFKKQQELFDTAVVQGICLPSDLSANCVMNHYTYVKDIQLAVHDFYIRTGLKKVISEQNNAVYQNATNIIHKYPISCFTTYKIKTQLIDWDYRHIYLIHYFTNNLDQVCTMALTRQAVVKGRAAEIIQPLYDATQDTEGIEEVSLWKEVLDSLAVYADMSEDLLRKPIRQPKREKRPRSGNQRSRIKIRM